MKKNDKLVVVLGVIILVIASIGIYIYEDVKQDEKEATIQDVFSSRGTFKDNLPEAIKVSNRSQFYPLVAAPLAVHYNKECQKEIMPLYIEDFENPSTAVGRVYKEQLDKYEVKTLDEDNIKDFSLKIAKDYWKRSKAVLLINDSQHGYHLGVTATPIASYLSIPVIVTDELDEDVTEVLDDLKVEVSIICGELEGYGKSFKLESQHEIINLTVDLLKHNFDRDVKYITVTNPNDAYPPKVLETDHEVEGSSGIINSANAIPGNLPGLLSGAARFSFEIPEDYKYCRVTMEIQTDEPAEDLEEFGDSLTIQSSLTNYISSIASTGKRDENGHLIGEKFVYTEVLYDMGGETYSGSIMGNFMKKRSQQYTLTVTKEKLDGPVDPLMPQLSSMAPYLTAHHMGIIYADPDMAFANDDHVKFDGENIPGAAQPRTNALLIPSINEHVYTNIHKPFNKLIAQLKDIDIDNLRDLKDSCDSNPYYIALLGDPTMIPQYYYRNPHSDPYGSHNNIYGTNTPSDFIYANIDPTIYLTAAPEEDFVENDIYATGSNEVTYPYMENIVGRITGGFDVQDTSALIARTVFYDDVLESMTEEWKNRALVMSGAGLEFQAVPGIDWIYRALGSKDPMKCPSGQQHFLSFRTSNIMEETGGFEVEVLERGQASRQGYSREALDEIKKSSIINRLFFAKNNIQFMQGLENVKSLFNLDWWKKAFDDESGIHGEESQESANLLQVNAHGIFFDYNPVDVQLYAAGGPPLIYQLLGRVFFPLTLLRSGLEGLAAYGVREVTGMEMGPSLMFVECCGGGKIDSLIPENTLSAAYLHSGVNAFICPSTLSAIGGYLEPRPFRLGWGLLGYLKSQMMANNNEYIHTEFCGWMFEEAYTALADDDIDIGTALRDARNGFIPDQIDVTYLWTPPLDDGKYVQPVYMKSTAKGVGNVPVEKYAAVYELNLLGDPMWNPYQPVNEGLE